MTETIEANFIGEWHGLYRTIPVEYVTPQGFNYTLFVKLDSATDAAGRKLRVESSREGHYLKWKIYVDGATDAVRTITLHYRVSNGLKFFEDHDELYWNVTGDEWDVPVGERQRADSSAGGRDRSSRDGIHGSVRFARAERRRRDLGQHREGHDAAAAWRFTKG